MTEVSERVRRRVGVCSSSSWNELDRRGESVSAVDADDGAMENTESTEERTLDDGENVLLGGGDSGISANVTYDSAFW